MLASGLQVELIECASIFAWIERMASSAARKQVCMTHHLVDAELLFATVASSHEAVKAVTEAGLPTCQSPKVIDAAFRAPCAGAAAHRFAESKRLMKLSTVAVVAKLAAWRKQTDI